MAYFNIEEAIEGLSDPSAYVRRAWLNAILSDVREDAAIAAALPAIGKMLSDPDGINQLFAVEGLMAIAYRGADMTVIMGVLEHALSDRENRFEACKALAFQYIRIGNTPALLTLMQSTELDIRLGAVEAFREKERQFLLEREDTRSFFPVFLEAFLDRNERLRENAGAILRMAVHDSKSLKAVEELERCLEQSLWAWNHSPRSDSSPETMAWCVDVRAQSAALLQAIAAKKALLVKMGDGELLAGETIPLPKNARERGIYRTTRRVGHD